MPIPVPTLSEDGWASAPTTVGDYLFCHFYLSENSQSYLYLGNITSLPGLIQQFKDDTNGLQLAAQSRLAQYFGRYFSNVSVEAAVTPEAEDSSRYTLELYISYTDEEGKPYVLGKVFSVMNTKIAKVIDANDNGAAHG